MLQKFLVTKDSKGKFRFFNIECDEEWNDSVKGYVIQRSYGQVGGKVTLSPTIIVDRTKQRRNWKEQYTLQFNSEVKKQLDKGYIELERDANSYSESELSELFGEVRTNQSGVIKPMLAKQESKLTNRKILDKNWLCSPKYDGVRCLMYWDGEQVLTASRGGENYNAATDHIRETERLINFFKENPSVILDGELYKHGKTLQQISGAARLEKNAYDCDWLEFHVYDMYNRNNPDMKAIDRTRFLYNTLGPLSTDSIHLVIHQNIIGEEAIWRFHDKYVEEGFEGCVVRDPERPYKPNGRTNDMIKFKNYKSEDFKVIGYELGRRGSEDMTFICELPDGKTFAAMPVGDRSVKDEYVQNFEEKYKGHLAECTYFNYSEEGIPTQPKLRTFRFDLE